MAGITTVAGTPGFCCAFSGDGGLATKARDFAAASAEPSGDVTVPAVVQYKGGVMGAVAGLMQIPVVLTVGNASTVNGAVSNQYRRLRRLDRLESRSAG